jgi:GR25 family glycosyltransferase involved in LPS biosynthesis
VSTDLSNKKQHKNHFSDMLYVITHDIKTDSNTTLLYYPLNVDDIDLDLVQDFCNQHLYDIAYNDTVLFVVDGYDDASDSIRDNCNYILSCVKLVARASILTKTTVKYGLYATDTIQPIPFETLPYGDLYYEYGSPDVITEWVAWLYDTQEYPTINRILTSVNIPSVQQQLYLKLRYGGDQNIEMTRYNLCLHAILYGHLWFSDKEYIYNVFRVVPKPNPGNWITFTITTCKRLDLFVRTMDSFLKYCIDKYLIKDWICIDDNSSEADRHEMQERYPFFKFIFKSFKDKGHARSMNMLLDVINTPYVFHMEDDWEYLSTDIYLTKCFNVLNSNRIYGQCLVNKNYMERGDIPISGGIAKETDNIKYLVHEYIQGGMQCSYWPHFSLRPGLTRVDVFRRVGTFSETVPHFEMDYAYRYVDKKYQTTFLDRFSCMHTGRLTSERFDDSKLNAYILNNENQFGNKVLESKLVKVINLERRPDRLEKFCSQNVGIFKVCKAVDGRNLSNNRYIEQLFIDNDYNYRRGIVGCALSHISCWIDCLGENVPNVILEDDATILVEDFDRQLDKLIDHVKDQNIDILFLGHHIKASSPDSSNEFERWTTEQSLNQSFGGTTGYIITPQGALNMLNYIQEVSMTNAIDTMMQKACDILTIHYLREPIVGAPFCNNEPELDSDIQNHYENMERPLQEMLQDEFDFYDSINVRHTQLENPEKYYCWCSMNKVTNSSQWLPKDIVIFYGLDRKIDITACIFDIYTYYNIHKLKSSDCNDIIYVCVPKESAYDHTNSVYRLMNRGVYSLEHILK